MSKCKYCDGTYGEDPSKELLYSDVNLGELGDEAFVAYIYDDKKLGISIGELVRAIDIKYCPMCGRKLDPKALEEAADDND